MDQKFHRGDLVHVSKELGPGMSHFDSDIDAIVIGSYADKYGGDDTESYTLWLKGKGECSWYEENQLILIEKNKEYLLAQWEKEKKDDEIEKSDIDWIFSNGKEVLENGYSSSIKTLGENIGIINLWGASGEGITYYCNAMSIMSMAREFLLKNDKDGWIKMCSNYLKKKK